MLSATRSAWWTPSGPDGKVTAALVQLLAVPAPVDVTSTAAAAASLAGSLEPGLEALGVDGDLTPGRSCMIAA